MSLTPAFLDELRARVSVSSVVGRRVKLVRAGREMKGCCPFHNEKTPSFHVNDDKGFYHCFGCGAHGDVIRFMTDNMGLPFMEAVKQLAGEAGLEVPAASPEAREKARVADSLTELTARAATWFQAQLAGDAGAAARDYLDRRGVTADVARRFGLGLALDGRTALRSHLKDAEGQALLDAGLIGSNEDGEIFDRFRGRLMFPIRDRRGRVVGFGGRALGDVQPKYLNSADGPLFDKGRLLYNLDLAGPAARQSGRLIVVEGYMDVIGLAQAGIADAVAPLGTAMTETQLALAWRLVDEPILCFDGDGAGVRAAIRAAGRALPLLQPGKSLRIAALPAGQDPDDMCRSGGAAAFEAVLAAAVPLIDHIWASETAGLELATPERRAQAKVNLLKMVDEIGDPLVKQEYRNTIRNRFWEQFGPRRERLNWQPQARGGRRREQVPPPSDELKRIAAGSVMPMLTSIFDGLLKRPSLADAHGDALISLGAQSAQSKKLDAVLHGVMEILSSRPGLDEQEVISHLWKTGLAYTASEVLQNLSLKFSFNRRDTAEVTAEQDFAMALSYVTSRPFVEQALAEATNSYVASLDHIDREAQDVLRRDLESLDAAMMKLVESRRED